MAVRTNDNSKLSGGWAQYDDGWGTPMNYNLEYISVFLQPDILTSTGSTPPDTSSFVGGEKYYLISGSGITGSWYGQDGKVAVWNSGTLDWKFYKPWKNAIFYHEDTNRITFSEGLYSTFSFGSASIETSSTGPMKISGDLTSGSSGAVLISREGVFSGSHVKISGDEWNILQIPISSMKEPGSGGPGWEQLTDDGSGSLGVYCYKFDKNSVESLYFQAIIPSDYKESTPIIPFLQWCCTDSTDTGNVIWTLEYAFSNEGITWGNTTLNVITSSNATGTALKLQTAEFQQMSGTGKNILTNIFGRIARSGSISEDNYDDDAALLGFGIRYKCNSIGSLHSQSKT